MTPYTVYLSASGEILWSGLVVSRAVAALQAAEPGWAVTTEGAFDGATHYLPGGALTPRPALEVTATEITADDEAAIVTVPAGIVIRVYALDGAFETEIAVLDEDSTAAQRTLSAAQPTTWSLRPETSAGHWTPYRPTIIRAVSLGS